MMKIKPADPGQNRFGRSASDDQRQPTVRLGRRRLARALAVMVASLAPLLVGHPAVAQTGPQPKLPTVDLVAGMHIIKAELAVTAEQQAIGMMGRKQMAGNEGMLFVNGDDQIRCFWMRNTLIPLAIAFLAADGTVINVAEMQPLSDQSHCSTRPARFALEMNQGWFAKRGIGPGFRLRGKPFGDR